MLRNYSTFDEEKINAMEIINHRIYPVKFNEHFAWIITLVLVVAGIPFLKAVFVFIVKVCELFVQYGFGR